jgi:acyl transferase domain-containing protein
MPLVSIPDARIENRGKLTLIDYGDMQNRDAEDRPANCAVGVGRTIMANRLSYFLNIKGPSITLDTACSGALVAVDLACRSLNSGEVNAAIVATSNFYLNPDHVMDSGIVGQTHSPTALCHTFDEDADGYVKAEAVSCIILKRLSDAIRDRDPIRAVIRGSASNRYLNSSSHSPSRSLSIYVRGQT